MNISLEELESMLAYEQKRNRTKKIALWTVAFLILVSIGAVVYKTGFIDKNPRVPSVVGLEKAYAASTLESLGFIPVESSDYSSVVEEGYVISQDSAEKRRPANSEIEYVVSLGKPPIVLEDYTGKNVEEAKELLLAKGLRVAYKEEYSDQFEENLVMGQDPLAGVTMEEDALVTLHVSLGKKEPESQAVAEIPTEESSEESSAVETSGEEPSVEESSAQETSPVESYATTETTPVESFAVESSAVETSEAETSASSEETKAPETTKAAAKKTTRKLKANEVRVPNVKGKTYDQAVQILRKSGLSYKYVIVNGHIGYHKVMRQSPAAGTIVKKGTAVKMNLSRY